MDAIERFAGEARQFVSWIETIRGSSGMIAARHARLRLAELYAAALALPLLPVSDDEGRDGSWRPDEAEVQAVRQAVETLPLDNYGQVLDPGEVPPEQAGVASLVDDIGDIYSDVVEGLRAYEAGLRQEAAWLWAFQFRAHWGSHALGALTALHSWLIEHDRPVP
jgi:hypothetical protein